jgi:Tfp pilus assembly protein PilN
VIRINLIPPEILQARKDEARWKWVWLGGGFAALAVAIFWAAIYLQLGAATTDVELVQQEVTALRAQTGRFAEFQRQEDELVVRKQAVDAAMKGKIDWSELLYELGLVLPRDVYLTTFTGVDNSAGGTTSGSVVTLAGQAVFDPDEVPANGYKSIAKMLVRLTELEKLDSVWLTSATLGPGTDTEAPMYQWSVNARITPKTDASTGAPSGQ